MAQARVTDFYSLRKSSGGRTPKITKPRRGSEAPHQDQVLCSFVRVVDEAAGLFPVPVREPGSPQTPKRTSAEFDLTVGGGSGTPSKRRVGGTASPGGATRRSARRRLQVATVTPLPQRPGQDVGPESRTSKGNPVDLQDQNLGGRTTKVLSGDQVASLRARLRLMKRRDEERQQPTSSPHKNLSRAEEWGGPAQREEEEKEEEKEEEDGKSEAATQLNTEDRDPSQPPPPGLVLPAHQRYHSLAQPAPPGVVLPAPPGVVLPAPPGLVLPVPPGLVLPYSYKLLAEMFRNMDTVVAMLYNRSETATFSKVQRGVQDLMHRRFEESHLAQIRFVFPEAFSFRQQQNVPTFSRVKTGSYQLTVEPVLVSDQRNVRPVLSPSALLERRRVFHLNLLSIVKQHHKVFLSSLVPPMSVPEDRLTRWHPRFNVDTVAPPPVATLPRAPDQERAATAREVLEETRSLLTPKMERALVSVALRTQDQAAGSPGPPAAPGPPAGLRGVPQSLVDRIRAKEAQKLQAVLTRNPAQDQRLVMMSRLGGLARILRGVFVAEKKAALIMEVVCKRLVSSYQSTMSTGEMEQHVRLLAELAADWLSIHPIRKDFYLKLNKSMELSTVLDRLRTRIQEEQRGGAGSERHQ